MKFSLTTAILAATVGVLPAYAQFGSGIVYDPTQSAHAIEQIQQGQQIFTNSVAAGRQRHRHLQPRARDGACPAEPLSAIPLAFDLLDGAEPGGQHLRQFAASGRIPSTPASARARVPAGHAFHAPARSTATAI